MGGDRGGCLPQGFTSSHSVCRGWLRCFEMGSVQRLSPPANRVSIGDPTGSGDTGESAGAGVIVSSAPTVVRRCFPAIHANKGVLMVGNETTYEDGHGTRKNITDLVEGAK